MLLCLFGVLSAGLLLRVFKSGGFMYYEGLAEFSKSFKPSSMDDDLFIELLAEVGANMLIHSSTKTGQSVTNIFLELLDAMEIPVR